MKRCSICGSPKNLIHPKIEGVIVMKECVCKKCHDEAVRNMNELENLMKDVTPMDDKTNDPLLTEALKVLGWQGGTVHEVLEVLRRAKMAADKYSEWNSYKYVR
jgi:hypothetical protein